MWGERGGLFCPPSNSCPPAPALPPLFSLLSRPCFFLPPPLASCEGKRKEGMYLATRCAPKEGKAKKKKKKKKKQYPFWHQLCGEQEEGGGDGGGRDYFLSLSLSLLPSFLNPHRFLGGPSRKEWWRGERRVSFFILKKARSGPSSFLRPGVCPPDFSPPPSLNQRGGCGEERGNLARKKGLLDNNPLLFFFFFSFLFFSHPSTPFLPFPSLFGTRRRGFNHPIFPPCLPTLSSLLFFCQFSPPPCLVSFRALPPRRPPKSTP